MPVSEMHLIVPVTIGFVVYLALMAGLVWWFVRKMEKGKGRKGDKCG